ncbi:ABC-type transport system, involved in lipoprotein release, permease component [Methanomethylovorans hollandica DSM 15978]|uniref:ABC-type transport system, involved in lipoprotein release, permease component n=1 Tax=Methanomethylovorans hollandica (strain DSM 15978 / NBRC 107637 / DMS1) TaxID=867904 RepID=L0KU50_METHD|nr:ABC-type transport system, involved in lipoprotein release, permease component [Methanomethylovorans hollandica DSM 15978]
MVKSLGLQSRYFKRNMYAELAKRNLRRHMARTVLAAVGIIIGVIAISSMGILGNSLKMSVSDSLGDVGNQLIVYPGFGGTTITEKQVEKIYKVAGIENLVPIHSGGSIAEYKNKDAYANVYGMGGDDLLTLVQMEKGRMYKRGSSDCVIGSRLAEDLDVKIGGKITVEDTKFRVIGILKERGMGFDISADSAVFMDSQTFIKVYKDTDEGYNNVIIQVKDIDEIDIVKADLEDRLNKKDEEVFVLATNTILSSIDEISRYISLFLMGISSISLLVAGVSILNVMLMSTMERTREIGIMKAVGASRKDVLKMFLLEALFLGTAASLIGGILSFGGGFLITVLIMKQASYLFAPSSLAYIIVGIGFGILTGVAGGVYPAWKAAQMRPLDALRYE